MKSRVLDLDRTTLAKLLRGEVLLEECRLPEDVQIGDVFEGHNFTDEDPVCYVWVSSKEFTESDPDELPALRFIDQPVLAPERSA